MSVECSPMAREIGVKSQFESYQRLRKMVLDSVWLDTQHYKVEIKGKVEQSRERRPPLYLAIVDKKRALGSPSTSVTNFTYIYIYIYIYCHRQKDCFVVSQLFSVVRHAGRFKLG